MTWDTFRGAKVVTVIKVDVLVGRGLSEDDVARIVTYYVDPDTGDVLARSDPWADARGYRW